jgi:hypothetical protein
MTDELRHALLGLHKSLVDYAKTSYESTHGPVGGPANLFRLLVDDPAFQWLRPLSETIVAIDEALETEPPATHAAIVAMVRGRLFPETATAFSEGLKKAAQDSVQIKEALAATQTRM